LYFLNGLAIFSGDDRIISADPSTQTGYLHGTWNTDASVISSDLRLKRDITPLLTELMTSTTQKTASETLRSIRPVAYSMENSRSDLTRRYGFIAQELEKVLPNLVVTSEDTEMKSVLYDDLVALLAGAIQEQETLIEQLAITVKSKDEVIDELMKTQNELKDRLGRNERSLQSMIQKLEALESQFTPHN
jgi:chromosome segregation ATPase